MAVSEAVYTPHELMAVCLSRDVANGETVACGANSPVPASALVLAKYLHAPDNEVIVLGSPQYYPFSGSGIEFFEFANRGGLDLFHVSGGVVSLGHEEAPWRTIETAGMWDVNELRARVPALIDGVANPAPPPLDLDLPGRPVAKDG